MKVSTPGPLYAGTTVPFGRPLVVFGDGVGSNCLVRSQYCVKLLDASTQLKLIASQK